MKLFYILLGALLVTQTSRAQVTVTKDSTTKTGDKTIFTSVERAPEFPGGITGFYSYISKNLQYPVVARLIGITGKVNVQFILDENGKITNATPKNCIGTGCEAEAARVLELCPAWKPGIQNGKAVRVMYTMPITFDLGGKKEKTQIKTLRKSDYGFVFSIKDTLYTIDEAEKILGKEFDPDQVATADVFYNYNKLQKFEMPDKKEVYLIIFKST
jgi:protein TonB